MDISVIGNPFFCFIFTFLIFNSSCYNYYRFQLSKIIPHCLIDFIITNRKKSFIPHFFLEYSPAIAPVSEKKSIIYFFYFITYFLKMTFRIA